MTTIITVDDLLADHARWSQATFGPDAERGPVGPLNHLQKEAKEAAENPSDLSEYADCFLLLVDATRRGGWSYRQLLDAAAAKLEVNKARSWGEPGDDGAVHHLKNLPPENLPPEHQGGDEYFVPPNSTVLLRRRGNVVHYRGRGFIQWIEAGYQKVHDDEKKISPEVAAAIISAKA